MFGRFFFLLALPLLVIVACKSVAPVAQVLYADNNADVMKEKFGLRVNIQTNMAVFFQSGTAIRMWKVATARKSEDAYTPTGKFRAHSLSVCAPFSGMIGYKGPCAKDNPSGKRALWFYKENDLVWGAHGVDDSHMNSVLATNVESRRASAGCVRNVPDDIRWLTNTVAELYGTNATELNSLEKDLEPRFFKPRDKGLAIEIGSWDFDPSPSL